MDEEYLNTMLNSMVGAAVPVDCAAKAFEMYSDFPQCFNMPIQGCTKSSNTEALRAIWQSFRKTPHDIWPLRGRNHLELDW